MIVIALTIALLVIAPVVAVPEIEADLTARTSAALLDQGHDWASATARGRTVTVGGEAPSEAERDTVLATVAANHGVGDVIDATTVSPFQSYAITFTRTASGTSLSGSAPNRAVIDALLAAIAELDPTAVVESSVAVEAGQLTEGWQNLVLRVVQQGGRLLVGQASVSADGIELSGSVASDAALAAIEEALAGIADVPVRIDIAVERPRIYSLTLMRTADGLTLAGEVPDAAIRADLIALAERQRVSSVEAEMLTVVPGVARPDWGAMAQALVRHIGSMREGWAELTPGNLSVTGVVVDPAMAEVVQTALSAIFGADERITVSIDVQPLASVGAQGTDPAITDLMAYGADAAIAELTDDQRLDAGTCQTDLNTLTSDDRIRFLDASAVLDPSGATLLEAIAVTLRACAGTDVEVSGHTDSSGDPIADEALSQLRAQAVVDYLVLRGVERDRLVAAGYGDQIPVADNTTEAGRVRNRRIEFLVDLSQ